MKTVLLDIEGTTTPVDFVYKTLFPFARARMPDFVRANLDALDNELTLLEAEHRQEQTAGENLPPFNRLSSESVAQYLCYLIDQDRKSTPLKTIQGKIWEAGYKNGEIKGEVFPDVPEAFKRWHKSSVTIAIYSSGSILAQQLLFKHSNYGDLTGFIADYFDTTTGAKRDAGSYQKIAVALGLVLGEILFASDITAELDAAQTAGMQTRLVVRPGNAAPPVNHLHQLISSLGELG